MDTESSPISRFSRARVSARVGVTRVGVRAWECARKGLAEATGVPADPGFAMGSILSGLEYGRDVLASLLATDRVGRPRRSVRYRRWLQRGERPRRGSAAAHPDPPDDSCGRFGLHFSGDCSSGCREISCDCEPEPVVLTPPPQCTEGWGCLLELDCEQICAPGLVINELLGCTARYAPCTEDADCASGICVTDRGAPRR